MNSLSSFIDGEFYTQQEQWEKSLLSELKLTEIGSKATKRLLTGQNWPTLSLKARQEVQLGTQEKWKKASTTYVYLNKEDISEMLLEDLEAGVRNFFFHAQNLDSQKWQKIEDTLANFSHSEELEVFILGEGNFTSSRLKVIADIISGQAFHDQGGHSIQELALMACRLIKNIDSLTGTVYLGVYVDSHFFHNIAKIRAAKLLAQKILTEANKDVSFKVVALTSYQGWSLYERYSNMLRNETAVASAYIGGADHVQSAGYNTILELEANNSPEKEHLERSRRMGRNTTHVLALESMLGVVEDAAYGSYHLENLTQALCEESWKLMQALLSGTDLTSEVAAVRAKRLEMIKTRRLLMSGINDYPDVKEHLNLKLKTPETFRVARIFEELRIKMENVSSRPQVYVALFGDYGALNARLNFVKNYFELLGLTVLESGTSELDLENFKKNLTSRKEEIIVLCALDDHYPEVAKAVSGLKASYKFIAGKFEMTGFTNLFAGQNVYEILEKLVSAYEGRES